MCIYMPVFYREACIATSTDKVITVPSEDIILLPNLDKQKLSAVPPWLWQDVLYIFNIRLFPEVYWKSYGIFWGWFIFTQYNFLDLLPTHYMHP